LACSARIYGDVLVFVPEQSRITRQFVLEKGKERAFKLNPGVRKYFIEVEKSTLSDLRGDFERVRDSLRDGYGLPGDLTIDFFALRRLPLVLRGEEGRNSSGDRWKATITLWNGKEIIHVETGRMERCLGLAVDVGTTTVAAYLCDLTSGEVIHSDSIMNPQVRYGEDVLSRLTFAELHEQGLNKLHGEIIDGINDLARRMTERTGLLQEDILEVVFVFNTAMHHITLGIEPFSLGRSPFAAGVKCSQNIKARDLGINVCPGANIYIPPVVAGFVGADNVALLIAEEPHKDPEKVLMCVDIGTNCEINISKGNRMLSTSCATGPALEGAQIKFGMRAASGAIEKVRIEPVTLEVSYLTTGQESWCTETGKTGARGICGSGIIDLVAEMFKAGIIDNTGRFNMGLNSPRTRRGDDGRPEFVVAWACETAIGKDITFTQGDVRAVQLAKAALYVGARFLIKKLRVDRVDGIALAGAFGSYINRESAMVIGMIPDCAPEKVVAVGNAAGDGAKLALFDMEKREEAEFIAGRVEFVETAVEPDFQARFTEAMAFPHSLDSFPHVRHILEQIPDAQPPGKYSLE